MTTRNPNIIMVSDELQFGENGLKINAKNGKFAFKNADDTDVVDINSKNNLIVSGQIINDVFSPLSPSDGEVYIVTTSGINFTKKDLYRFDVNIWKKIIKDNDITLFFSSALTGGEDTYIKGVYIWKDGVFNSIASSELSESRNVKSFRYNLSYTNNQNFNVGLLPNNSKVIKVLINVITPFNGVNSSLIIGDDLINDRLLNNSDIDLKSTGLYQISNDILYALNSIIKGVYTSDSSTQGEVTIEIIYTIQ